MKEGIKPRIAFSECLGKVRKKSSQKREVFCICDSALILEHLTNSGTLLALKIVIETIFLYCSNI